MTIFALQVELGLFRQECNSIWNKIQKKSYNLSEKVVAFFIYIVNQTAQIKLPKGTELSLVQHKQFHELTVLLQLKSFYKSNSIHNYQKRIPQLASIIGTSESKLRKALAKLFSLNLAWKESTTDGIDLRLAGKQTLKSFLDAPKTNKTHKLNFTTNKDLETYLKGLAIKQNLNQQAYIIRKKVADKLGMKRGTNRWTKQLFYKTINETIDNLKVRPQRDFPQVKTTLSRKSIAGLLNRKSSRTGHRWMEKFKQLNLITKDIRRFEFLNIPATKRNIKEMYSYEGGRLREYKGWLYLIQSNEIEMA